jgi:hypothetical protein
MITAIMSSSFVYEDLVAQVQMIQNRTVQIENVLYDRYKNDDERFHELKSRSLTWIDPYGNRINDKHLDHELIDDVIKRYKKNYVPKYLQEWIRIGIMNENIISSLNDWELKSTVSNFTNDYQFITYGHATVWCRNDHNSSYEKLILRVSAMDTMEKIKMQIKELRHFIHIELKLCMINDNAHPNETDWNEGETLNSEDTVMACRLYEGDCVIVAKLSNEKVTSRFSFN